LKLFKENYSPDLLRKITYAGAHSTNSFEYAKENLKTLAEIDISTSHIQRLTIRIAMEFDEKESRIKDNWDKECIKQIDEVESPEVASISVDGGRTQIRKEDCGAGVHGSTWTEKSKDKIDKLKSIHTYFQNNFTKMNYPLYRKKGLPISSCHVESLIKQFNLGIKSSEKFWNLSSVKGIIKIKASILSNDDSYQQFWNGRYDNQVVFYSGT
ncbi:hypothetical protein HZA55_09345, partial [Candidatus Poribacteria bacterium]|nr:hypothetical protein [Candidatus Poribacteria bacterium]